MMLQSLWGSGTKSRDLSAIEAKINTEVNMNFLKFGHELRAFNRPPEHTATIREKLAFYFPYEPEKPVPDTIWQTWKVDLDDDKFPAKYKRFQSSWVIKNPDYHYHLIPDNVIDQFVEQMYANVPEVVRAYHLLPKNIMKADFFRYLVIHARGGTYSDMDTICLKPIKDWATFSKEIIYVANFREFQKKMPMPVVDPESRTTPVGLTIGIEADPDRPDWHEWFARRVQFCQWTIQGKPGHPLLRELIIRIVEETFRKEALGTLKKVEGKDSGQDVMQWTGPGIFTDNFFDYVNNVESDGKLGDGYGVGSSYWVRHENPTASWSTVTTFLENWDKICYIFGNLSGINESHSEIGDDPKLKRFLDQKDKYTLDEHQRWVIKSLLEFKPMIEEFLGFNFIVQKFTEWMKIFETEGKNTIFSYARTYMKVLKLYRAISDILHDGSEMNDRFDLSQELFFWPDNNDADTVEFKTNPKSLDSKFLEAIASSYPKFSQYFNLAFAEELMIVGSLLDLSDRNVKLFATINWDSEDAPAKALTRKSFEEMEKTEDLLLRAEVIYFRDEGVSKQFDIESFKFWSSDMSMEFPRLRSIFTVVNSVPISNSSLESSSIFAKRVRGLRRANTDPKKLSQLISLPSFFRKIPEVKDVFPGIDDTPEKSDINDSSNESCSSEDEAEMVF
ncbi:hypothetical protein OGAPHI_005880 [Ogataea philodendri]|uniref:Mannosyltransferase n=1 Tax=Ogataea philodendri TaxID=1378263 RepID=A0A9P8T1B6_9ASCO|nr:uncharacterized protein OGAPHI_005880 [Ogataea philodendri]KAH3662628.1 hypothetical protein OGAPHI_005880 [Ogataea philodendri]